ncbi:TonB-dependent receptor plug domain-containing protein [Rufibacter immobilis]|uniref:TonB-dependent receptor plug domain-containing protein n=1 Tax=Rufibacter immobilis TaxID=1348778 RepID=UPI00160D0449|nr:TonB-dependent receptor plug domain-containing protein [Rufibacter immobilis]
MFFSSAKRTLLSLLIIAALAVSGFTPLWPQTDIVNRLLAKLEAWNTKFPQEKVYLHLDKPYYAAGEDIWFKAYLVKAQDHVPSALSKVLYVELITPENTFYKSNAVSINRGRGQGSFALPDDLPEGTYRLRAFTSWMQNFPEDYIFHQNITIYSPRKNDLVTSTAFTHKRQSSGDSILVNLRLLNHQEKPLGNTSVSYSTNFDRKASSRKASTNAEGKTILRFFLPDGETKNPKLHLTVEQPGGNINKTIPFPSLKEQVDVQFFPEGGNLVSGLWNTVGFKAVDANGLGKDVQGAIYDQSGQKVADLKSLKYGMGRFGFIPDASKKYVARLTSVKGAAKEYPLPAPQKKGFILSVDNKVPDKFRLKFYMLGFNTDSTGKPKALNLIAQVRGQVVYAAASPVARELFQADIPLDKLPAGIVQFTVFSETGEPLAERLAFVKRAPQVQLTLTPDKPAYKPREKVTLQVQAKDETGAPVAGNFSLAITDQKAVTPAPNAASIVSYLLMSSDLKGHVEDPSYYFNTNTPEAATALDNLMLTQGWRRFVWKDVVQDKYPQMNFAAEKGLYISGTVNKIAGLPDAYASVSLMDLNNLQTTITGQADGQGKFQFNLNGFTDSANLVVQAGKGIGSLLTLDNNLPQLQVFPQVPYEPVPAPYSNEVWAYLRRNREQLKLDQFSGKSGILLRQVEIRGQKQEERKATSSTLYSTPDHVLKGAELPRGQDVIQSLQGRVAGLQVSNGQVVMRGGGPAMFLLDGMPIDAEFIRTLTADQVETVEILKPGASSAMYGSRGGNGVVAITTKRGGSDNGSSSVTAKLPGTATYQGLYYQKHREFYMPRYDKPDASNVEMPDLRTTLYWNPSVQTDAAGKGTVTLFTADQKTTYRAILEGMSPDGKLGHLVASFQVK